MTSEGAAATADDDKTVTDAAAVNRNKKKNFNLKKQLSKADTKLRDLFAPVGRRGSAASAGSSCSGSAVGIMGAADVGGAIGGGGGNNSAGGLVSPHLPPDSKPVSPQEEQPAFHFPEPAHRTDAAATAAAAAALPPLPPPPASATSDSHPVDMARTNKEIATTSATTITNTTTTTSTTSMMTISSSSNSSITAATSTTSMMVATTSAISATTGAMSSSSSSTTSSNLALFDADGVPIRPPRRLKKALSTAAPQSRAAACRDSGWKRTWYSSDEAATTNLTTPIAAQVLDLRFDATDEACNNTAGFLDNLVRRFNKSDTAFTRSRSSSTSSLENQTNEAVTTLTFADTLARKLDTAVSASLWVGTSQGSVLVIVINLAAPGEPRLTQPVMVSPSGSIFRVKGSMLCVAFIEPMGSLISNPSEPWRDETKESREQRSRTPTRSGLPMSLSGAAGGVGCDAPSSDDQYTVMVSEKQARVVSLPSQTCLYRVNLASFDNVFAVTANVISLKDGPCLTTFLSNGHIQVFSLPSLRPLMDVEFTPLVELSFQTSRQNLVDPMLNIWAQQQLTVNEDSDKIARNFRFSAHGHGMYLCSPSEIEKFTISSAFTATLGDLMGELFLPCDMPEPPKEGFFKGLFGGGVRPIDREELFGESTGKAGRGVARHIPGPAANLETLNFKAGSVAAEVQKTRMALNERGDKLSALEDRTQRMANEAENFSNAAHQLMVRCRERKWYQL